MTSNRDLFLACTGSISDETADDLQKTVREEFSKIEGEWWWKKVVLDTNVVIEIMRGNSMVYVW